jgi:hypothetical protein
MGKQSEKAKAEPKAEAKGKRTDPFKTRKTREEEPQGGDTLTAPEEVAKAIDLFRESQEQAKHFEGEATVQKDLILEYSQAEYTKRVFNGKNRSFKILGEQGMVMYVVMDASAGLTEADVEAFTEQWGEEAAEELITRDLGSIRFDPEVLEANYEAVVEALQVLPKKVLDSLFKPMLMKAKPGSVEKAKRYAKNPDELRELIQQLKIKNYIR